MRDGLGLVLVLCLGLGAVAGRGILLVDKTIYPAGKTTCPEEEDKLILWGPVTFDGL